MIEVYLLSVTGLRDAGLFDRACGKLDATRLAKAGQAKRTEDKLLRMGAGLLLQYAVKRRPTGTADKSPVFVCGKEGINRRQVTLEEVLGEIREPLEFSFKYGPHGKPYLEQYPELFFSLSHSGDYVICALAGKEVGVDIQKVPPMREGSMQKENSIMEKYYLPAERAWIRKSMDEKETRQNFYQMWAAKEAFMKLTGKGLSRGLDSFEIDMDKGCVLGVGEEVKVYNLPAPEEYAAALCVGTDA